MSIGDALGPVATSLTLNSHTYELLRSAILDMEIYDPEADLRLDERRLAERLGVSRTPVREALVRLAQEGLVEIVPRRGAFVNRKSLAEVLEIVIAWAAIEGMAARLAAEVATDRALRDLRRFALRHGESAARADIAEYSEANLRFHQTIIELSGCALLSQIADGLFVHMNAVRRRAMGEGNRASRSVVDHMEIVEALEARSPERAYQAVLAHTMRLHEHIKRTWLRMESFSLPAAAATEGRG